MSTAETQMHRKGTKREGAAALFVYLRPGKPSLNPSFAGCQTQIDWENAGP